ncbi:hypothetical protein BDA96_03G036100 [Sorghum bicolor]|uniref:Uncharacterized protein n=1 Tax=Sorghum bicolor TaxID=4558 RepID=A0A921RB46_SORBI|nr:hypothetical protein BDA96_03G036100 [Sorghum bicolor]
MSNGPAVSLVLVAEVAAIASRWVLKLSLCCILVVSVSHVTMRPLSACCDLSRFGFSSLL